MADSTKTFNTRIKQKFDTYANWEDTSTAGRGGNLVLLQGEIAVSHLVATGIDKFFVKVGDGSTPYKDLPYITTVDSMDVPDWAKQDELPVTTTGSGDIVHGVTFASWTVGTVTYYGLEVEKTNTVGSLYATSTIKVANPTSATSNIATIVPTNVSLAGTNTSVSIATNSISVIGPTYTSTVSNDSIIIGSVTMATDCITVVGSNTTTVIDDDTIQIGCDTKIGQNYVETLRFGSTNSTSTIGNYVLKEGSVLTSTNSVLTTTQALDKQLVNKAYADTKSSILSTDAVDKLAYVGTDGSYKRVYNTSVENGDSTQGLVISIDGRVGISDSAYINSLQASNVLACEDSTVIFQSTKTLREADVVEATSVDMSSTDVEHQIVNKKYVDGKLSGKADLASTSNVVNLALVGTDGQYDRFSGVVASGTSLTLSTSTFISANSSVGFSNVHTLRTIDVTDSTSSGLDVTQIGQQIVNKKYVDEKIEETISSAVVFRGATATLPDSSGTSTVINGDMYKASATFTIPTGKSADDPTATVTVYPGDTIIANVTGTSPNKVITWWYIPSADEDTWRPIQVKGTSIASNTLNVTSDGTWVGLSVSTASGVAELSISHSGPGTADATIGSLDKTTSNVTFLQGFQVDKFGHVQKSSGKEITFINGSHTEVLIGSNATTVCVNHDGVGTTSGTYTASSGKYVSGVEYDSYNHVSGITEETLPSISVTGTDPHIEVSSSGETFTVSHGISATASGTVSIISTDTTGGYVKSVYKITKDDKNHLIGTTAGGNIRVYDVTIPSVTTEASVNATSVLVKDSDGTTVTTLSIDTTATPFLINSKTTKDKLYFAIDQSWYDATASTTNKIATVKTVEDVVNALDSTITTSGSATTSQVSVFTKITETNGKLATTGTTSVLLATVASTGKIEDLIQSSYVIFDCGTSLLNI